ncbi:hypothetical protein JTB14_022647 [Gonioctena quinquepunctata]|nr:hypothetical protein JTB14_022647 [Gonioctena quinquepunctata]
MNAKKQPRRTPSKKLPAEIKTTAESPNLDPSSLRGRAQRVGIMGCFGSKDKLSKEDMDFLKSHTRYDESTIKEWYKGFKSSIKRKDNKYKLLVGLKSIVVHDACRKRYNNEKLIAAALRRGSDGTTSQVQLRSTRPTFSFKNHCFLCAAEITAEFISKQKQTRLCERNIVYSVRKLSMKNSISELARARNDDWGQAIVERLEQVTDLVAADAQYHNSCMTRTGSFLLLSGIYIKKVKNWIGKAGLKCSVVCTNCGGSCDNSQFPSQDDIEEEETDTILEQINDEIENEEDHDETDDPIVDDAEETSVFDISIGIEDDENPTPGPSTRMKRRKLN